MKATLARGRGFSNHNECLAPMVIMAILAAVAVPTILQARNALHDWHCARNLQQMATGGKGGEANCPHDGGAYAWKGDLLACPAAKSPLPSRPRYVRRGGAVTLVQDLPKYEQPSERSQLLEGYDHVFATRRPDGSVVVEQRVPDWRRNVVVPVMWLGVFGAVGLMCYFAWSDGTRTSQRLGQTTKVGLGCSLPALAFLLTWTYVFTREEVITFEQGGAVSVQVAHYGETHGEPERVEAPLALLPIRGTPAERASVGILVDDDGDVVWRLLVSIPSEHVGVIGGIATVGSSVVAEEAPPK